MLYTRKQLRNLTLEEHNVAIGRYFHKIRQNETGKICPHECEYLSVRLRSIYHVGGNDRVLEPYDQPFLWESIFKYLILLYLENLDFLMPSFDGVKELTAQEIAIDKVKFEVLLSKWRGILFHTKVDRLVHEVRLEYLRKLQIVKDQYKQGYFGRFYFERRCLEQELNAFYIYFAVKMFFKNLKANFLEFIAFNQRFVVTAFSYVHILSRHYIPKLNGIDSEKSFNEDLPFIAPFELPHSLATLIGHYATNAPQDYQLNPEYMAFKYGPSDYMIWWKYKRIEVINGQVGFELRTMYKIESAIDRERINQMTCLAVGHGLSFYY